MDDHNPIAQYWDLIQQAYDYTAETDRIVDLFAGHGVRHVLDLGCGTGSHLIELAKHGYGGVGVDRSADMVQVARGKARRLGLSLEFCQADMFRLPFLPQFDATLSIYVMSSLLDKTGFGTALRAIRRALRPGGLLVFNALNAEFEGATAEPSGSPQSLCYMDLGFRRQDVSLVRFNRAIVREEVQDWTYLYLIQDQEHLSVQILNNPMRTFTLGWIQERLAAGGFRYRSVKYVDVGEFKNWDMLISATAE